MGSERERVSGERGRGEGREEREHVLLWGLCPSPKAVILFASFPAVCSFMYQIVMKIYSFYSKTITHFYVRL